jgi:hypothetical protein
MRIFKSRRFAKFARRERITDETLIRAIIDADQGVSMPTTAVALLNNVWRVQTKESQAAIAR